MTWKAPGQTKSPNELFREVFGKTTRKSKYRNEPTQKDRTTDGYSFASKLEREVYFILKMRAAAGEIEILQVQDHVYLTDAEIEYVPDFKCQELETGETFWVEAKGFEKPDYKIKKRLWKKYGPGKLEEWRGSHERPYLHEVVLPKERANDERCERCGFDRGISNREVSGPGTLSE